MLNSLANWKLSFYSFITSLCLGKQNKMVIGIGYKSCDEISSRCSPDSSHDSKTFTSQHAWITEEVYNFPMKFVSYVNRIKQKLWTRFVRLSFHVLFSQNFENFLLFIARFNYKGREIFSNLSTIYIQPILKFLHLLAAFFSHE